MDPNYNANLAARLGMPFNSVSADPEVLRVLYERVLQRNRLQAMADLTVADFLPASYYDEHSWRDQVTVSDAQWLHDLGISPL